MELKEKDFLKNYHRHFKENDLITTEILNMFLDKDSKKRDLIIKCNDLFNIPPLLSFIILKSDEDFLKIVKKEFEYNVNKQYYGKLFGFIFNELGYKKDKSKVIPSRLKQKTNLHNASCFVKNNSFKIICTDGEIGIKD